ncbi:SDR family oxidoreductase [Nocardia wallacei]|uniref:SDR family oxidoreductase n=1 Tax=Nocardia wallacei TaxID=480035 RepID=UPI002458BF1D|nr:NAD(P)H-binding protein [Nocardia wallacei]
MQVAVLGATGMLGAPVVRELLARGHDVRMLSRSAPQRPPAGAEHRAVDVTTGHGLEAALAGVDTVVDAVSTQGRADSVLVEGVRRVLDAEQRAGVGHHVEISIVGCDQVGVAYFRAKVAQERLVTAGPVPWTLLRATQFHEFLDDALASAARYRIALHGAAKVQPVDVEVVASRLADAVDAGPSGRLPDIGGPATYTLTEASALRRARIRRALLPIRIPTLGRTARALRDGALCVAPGGETASFDYAAWLDRRTACGPTAG